MSANAGQPSAAALAWVPGVRSDLAPLRIEKLLGGSVNDSWRVDTERGRFVLRVDGPPWRRPGVEREREHILHEAAARGGLAPRIVLQAPDAGVRVCEYLDGRSWTAADFVQPLQLRRLGDQLAQLHALPVPLEVEPFDPGACARAYLSQLGDEPAADPNTRAQVASVDAAALRVAAGTRGLAIVHGDLAHGNLLDGERLWLLDFEYAQVADPLYDIACVLAYYPEARAQIASLLSAANLNGADLAERLAAAESVYATLSELWHAVRADEPSR